MRSILILSALALFISGCGKDQTKYFESEFSSYEILPIHDDTTNSSRIIFYDIEKFDDDGSLKIDGEDLVVETNKSLDTANFLGSFYTVRLAALTEKPIGNSESDPYTDSFGVVLGFEYKDTTILFRDPADTKAFLTELEAAFN